jgi:hypothetical protein
MAQTSGCTTVTFVTVLFVGTGSVLVVLTTAWFVRGLPVGGVVPVTVMVMGVARGYATVPRVQVMVPPVTAPHVPCELVADAPVRAAGSVSTSVTPEAEARPRFVTWIV